MDKKKRPLFLVNFVGVLAVGALILSACGSSATATPTGQPAASPTVRPAAPTAVPPTPTATTKAAASPTSQSAATGTTAPTATPRSASTPTPAPTAAPTQVGPSKSGGTLRVYHTRDTAWDPDIATASFAHGGPSMIYSRLMVYPQGRTFDAHDFTPVPDLVDKWEMRDPTTYVFNLRQGVKFQDKPPVNGRELVAADIKWSYERKTAAGVALGPILKDSVASIDAPDKYTLIFKLKQPFGAFIDNAVTNDWGEILAQDAGQDDAKAPSGKTFAKPASAIGTGPFMLSVTEAGVRDLFVRNPTYFKKDAQGQQLPYLESVESRLIANAATRSAAFRTGQLDWIDSTVTGADELQKAVANATMEDQFSYYPIGLFYRTDQAPFTDIRVRQAISKAIDLPGWNKATYLGRAKYEFAIAYAQKRWYLPVDQYPEDARKNVLDYNVAGAKQLLAQAGFPTGFKTTVISTNGYGTAWVENLELVVYYLKQVGIEAEIKLQESSAFVANANWGKYDSGMVYAYGGAVGTDPHSRLQGMFRSNGFSNISHINDPDLDKMIDNQALAADPAQRKKILDELQVHMAKKLYFAGAPAAPTVYFYQAWVEGFRRKTGSHDVGRQYEITWVTKR